MYRLIARIFPVFLSAIDFYHVSEIMKSVNLLKKWACLSWRCYQRERQAAKAGRRREALSTKRRYEL
jgi:hypothetical protein